MYCETTPHGKVLKALNRALTPVLSRVSDAGLLPLTFGPVATCPVCREQPTTIDSDPQMKAFILSLKISQTLDEIVSLCEERFGSQRSPSKSGLLRYIQKLQRRGAAHSRTTGEINEGDKQDD